MQCRANVESHNMGAKRKRRSSLPTPTPELTDEILVMEILARLPVKSLLRCRSVCKAWRDIISSDPIYIFIRAHLRRSATRWEQDPCFVISPHTLDFVLPEDQGRWPTTFSTHIRFYQWRASNNGGEAVSAEFLDAKEFGNQFNQVHCFSHCDGLVFAPTGTWLYVFNPATREVLRLPDTGRKNLWPGRRTTCYCSGLGLDRRTGKYKVVQAFYRSVDRRSTGMDVFTIANEDGAVWREIASDPPYPAQRSFTGLSINGYMFWRIAKPKPLDEQRPQPPRGLLHLSLEDEEFGITGLPESLDSAQDDVFLLDVLHGRNRKELCLTASNGDETMLTIWTLAVVVDGEGRLKKNSPWDWERRYSIQVPGLFQPMALPPCSSGGIVLWKGDAMCRYDLATCELTTLCEMDRMRYQGRREREWKDLFFFNVKPYTESLVPITKGYGLLPWL